MKLFKIITVFTILSTSSLFASSAKHEITLLINKINKAPTVKEKNLLLKKLDEKLQDDFVNAQQIINNKLKIFKFI